MNLSFKTTTLLGIALLSTLLSMAVNAEALLRYRCTGTGSMTPYQVRLSLENDLFPGPFRLYRAGNEVTDLSLDFDSAKPEGSDDSYYEIINASGVAIGKFRRIGQFNNPFVAQMNFLGDNITLNCRRVQ